MLELKNVSFGYKSQLSVLSNVSLRINSGDFLAVIGRNGSGKTTLTRIIMALKKPSNGEVLFDGQNAKKYSAADMAHHIGYVFQNPDRQFFRETAAQEVAYGPEQLGYTNAQIADFVKDALSATGLSHLADAYPQALSKGEKQRLAIASALAMHPKLLILDEPTSGQDALEKQRLMKLLVKLNQDGMAILLITHDMDLAAAYPQRAIVMNNGTKAFDGKVSELFSNAHQLSKWGLTEPAALKISRGLISFGVEQTTSANELSHHLIELLGRTTHADVSTAN